MAWASRTLLLVQGVETAFLGREALLENKRSAGRAKDLLDVQLLERALK